MKLSKEHINQLYKFTRAHYVEWYDLQTELVDHLANDIEHIWEENPKLSFDQAKSKAFKKFGIFGFGDVISEKSNALNKNYWKMAWQIFKDYFKLPKVIITLIIAIIIFDILNNMEQKNTFFIVLISIISIVPILYTFYHFFANKRKNKKTGLKWMFEDNLNIMGGFLFIGIQVPNILINLFHVKNINFDFTTLVVTSFIIALYAVFIFILVMIIPKRMKEKMAQQYPEYKLYKKA